MTTLKVTFAMGPAWRQFALILLAMAIPVAAIALTAHWQREAALGIALATPLAIAVVAWPTLPTLAVIFILYTNAAVVAVKFHGVPYLVGASAPLLLAFPLGYYLLVRRQKVVVDAILPLILLFLAAQAFSAAFSDDLAASLGALAVSAVEGLCLYFLMINVVRTPEMLRRVIWVLLAAGAFMGGLSGFQQFSKTYSRNYWGFAQMSNATFGTGQTSSTGEVMQHRLAGPLGEQNRYAQIMLMLAPLGLMGFWSERSRLLRLAGLAAAGLAALGMTLTFSRGAAAAFLLTLAIMVFLRYIKLYQCGLVLAGALVILLAVPQYATRFASLVRLEGTVTDSGAGIAAADSSVRSRVTEMKAALTMFLDRPWTGVGPARYPYHYEEYARAVGITLREKLRQPHDLYLGIAAEMGAPGLAAFLLLMATMFYNLVRARRLSAQVNPALAHTVTGLLLALVAYLASGIFLHFAFIRYFWLMMGLAGAASLIAVRQASIDTAQALVAVHSLASTEEQ